MDNDRTFNFNNKIKRYAYVADGEDLVYDFNISTSGRIAMRAYTDVEEDIQYFIDGKDDNGKTISLFRGENNAVCLSIAGSVRTTSLKFTTNEWHTIAFSFKESVASSSQGSEKYLDVRVIVDNESWCSSVRVNSSYKNIKFMIGKAYLKASVSSNFGYFKTNYPLWGQIEMIATRPAYCELSTLNTLMAELEGLTKVSEFDDFGMLKKIDIHQCGKSILSNTYEYKKRNFDSRYISKQVSKETIKCGTSVLTRNYEIDALGNITKIIDDTFGNHEYKYDYRGYLIEADGESYAYDGNGNITKRGSFLATFDSLIKDKLVSFNGIKVEYDPANPLNPKSYNGNQYEFEGRRLVRRSNGGIHYDYVYNDQGLRIQKKNHNGVTWNYTYDGDRLIRETSINGSLDFLYDEYGNLYGFIKDNLEKYLYIRDSFQNILGIADINGKIVVKYKYDAWGITSTKEDISLGIGDLNPFRYKGYYYDKESKMYYCKTRYYIPLWGRWLNADSTKYLEFKQLNRCNLFLYCYNNPINVCDENGNLPTWAKWLLGGALIAASVAITIATSGLGGAIAASIGGGFLGNIVGGAIAGAMVGVSTSALTNIGTQIIQKDIGEIDRKEVAYSALIGGAAGAISGGIFGGIQHLYNEHKIAESVAKLNSAENRLNSCFNPLKNIKDYVGKPFGNAKIVNNIADALSNYSNAYVNYVSAKATYSFVVLAAKVGYFIAESILNEEITKLFE